MLEQWRVDCEVESFPSQEKWDDNNLSKWDAKWDDTDLRTDLSKWDAFDMFVTSREVPPCWTSKENKTWWRSTEVCPTESGYPCRSQSSADPGPHARTPVHVRLSVTTTICSKEAWSQEEKCGREHCVCRWETAFFGACKHLKQVEKGAGEVCMLLRPRATTSSEFQVPQKEIYEGRFTYSSTKFCL